jgi:hypothetical protein
MFRLRFNETSKTTPEGSVTIQYDFSSALPVSAYLVLADFDVKESLRIQAYDSANALIPFASLSFARENGRDPGGASLTKPTWTSEWALQACSRTETFYPPPVLTRWSPCSPRFRSPG